jgi:hypothetical protein
LAAFVVLALPLPARAALEWQVRPFIGATFGGDTTLILGEAGRRHVMFGGGAALLGDVVGIDVDFGHSPGFFKSEGTDLVAGPLITGSRVTTLTGNVVVGLPRSRTAYTLRPYVVGGLGFMRARIDDVFDALSVTMTQPAVDVGGGVTGFVSNRAGLSWELRYFRSLGGTDRGLSIGPEQLSFWRANMAVIVRL